MPCACGAATRSCVPTWPARAVNRRYLPQRRRFPTRSQRARRSGRGAGRRRRCARRGAEPRLSRAAAARCATSSLPAQRLCWATKGFEVRTAGCLPYEVAQDVLGTGAPHGGAVRSHLRRRSGRRPADRDDHRLARCGLRRQLLAHDLSSANFRAYTSTDIVGVEVGGAVKNVLAIGAGLSDGLGFGANTRIALITRGLLEMMRLGVALGAQRETFMGLAGLGDLVLTCTDDQSRNRRFGLLLARGLGADAALAEIGQVVEGYVAARALRQRGACASTSSMPICEGIYGVLYDAPARRAKWCAG